MAKLKKREFKPLNTKRVKEGASRTNSKYDSTFKQGVNTLRMKVGVNNLRIARGTDATYWGETLWVHGYVGVKESSYLCPKMMGKAKQCPICDAANDAAAAGDKDEASQLSAKERVICYVVNRDDEKAGLVIWDMAWSQARDIDAVSDTRRGVLDISHPDTGFDISIQRTGSKLATRYSGLQVDRESSPLSEDARQQDAWIDEIDRTPLIELLKYYPAEYLSDILSGKVEEKDEGDLEDERPARGRHADENAEEDEDERPARRTSRDEEEDERPARRARRDESEEEDERPARRNGRAQPDEEEEEKPARRARRDEPDDEDEQPAPRSGRTRREEPAEEEDEKPARRSRSKDDEEEDERPVRRARRDEEEDEKPARGRRERDEEEEDERPQRRTR